MYLKYTAQGEFVPPEPELSFLAVVELFRLIVRLVGQVHAQALEDVLVHAREDDG